MTNTELPEGIRKVSKKPKQVNEAYFTGGSAMDPYLMNNGGSKDNYGYHYKTLAFNHNMEMAQHSDKTQFTTLGKGSMISAKNRNGDLIKGHIFRIKKDSDGYIINVLVLVNGKAIPVDIDTIRPIGGGYNRDFLSYIKESFTPKKAVVMESLIRNGHVSFIHENNSYIGTMFNGKPYIVRLDEGKMTSLIHLLSADEKLLESLFTKQQQLDIVQKHNPMLDDYHKGIRSVDDILTYEEAIEDEESYAWPDWSKEDALNALQSGTIVVYSSKPIENGVFVTPSYAQATTYAGNQWCGTKELSMRRATNAVYQKEVALTDVAWIDASEGQYTK